MIAPRHIHGQLLWADNGRVEAWWRVAPTTYRYLRGQQKRDFYARLRAALTALPEDSMILSLCGRVEPAEVVSRMVEGVDLEAHGAWIDECTATLDALAEFELFEREFFLSVDITGSSRWANAKTSVSTAASLVGQAFGMAAPPVSAAERDRRQLLADDITAVLQRLLPVEPATGAELDWISARAPRRGLGEPTLGAARAMFAGSDVRCRAAFDAGVVYHEGGRRGRDKPGAYLAVEVDTGDEVEVSYQAHLVMADMPATFTFPGTEWLPAADHQSHPVDWAVRIRRTDNPTAQRKATHRQRQLMAQVDEHDGDSAGLPPALADALRSIDTERAALAASPNEPSLEVSTIFAVWADTRAECLTRAKQLRAAYEAHEFSLPRPIGGQLDLHHAMRPGGALPRVCGDYTQYLMPADLAGAAPFAGTELGDPHGVLFGFSLDGDCPRPVLLDPAWGPKIRRGGNLIAVGDPGAGKSYAFKILAGGVAARGGRPVVVDRTPSGEWVRWAGTLPGHVEIITVTAGSKLCFDPLRVFHGEDAEQAALGFLQILTGVSPREGDGITLAEAVRAVARRGGHLVDVIEELRGRGDDDQVARDVARKLEHIRGARGAGLAFGDGRVPDLQAADTVVFHVPGLQLPTRDELGSEWLRSRLRDEQVFSQGLIYLVAATARHVAYSDLTRYSPLVIDEDWVLSGPEGEQLQLEVLRDGRKHNAGLWTSSQLIGDWTPDQLRLATMVLILRQDRLAAEATLRAFDLEASEEVIRQISTAESGQALLLDLRRRAGMVAICAPADPAQRAAYDTTPTGAAAEPELDPVDLAKTGRP